MKYTNSAVGGGPDGYDYHDDGDTMEWNDVKANNTYSTVRPRSLDYMPTPPI